jgi:hypothetical protein
MAGDWIKMRADLHTHPKVVRISSALKADRLRVIGGLHAVWCLFDVHSVDGSLSGYTPQAVDEMIGFPGFSDVMAQVKWLEILADGLALPEFEEHNGQSAKRRALETQRKRREREEEQAEADRIASASHADKKRAREEKRREEKDIGAKPQKRKSLIPEDFAPNETGQASATGAGLNLTREVENFRNHHKAKGTEMLDWQAAWRTWVGKAVEFGRGKPGNDDPYGLKGAL